MKKEVQDMAKASNKLEQEFKRYSQNQDNFTKEGNIPFKKKQLEYVSRILEIKQIIRYQMRDEEYDKNDTHPRLRQLENTLKNIARVRSMHDNTEDTTCGRTDKIDNQNIRRP